MDLETLLGIQRLFPQERWSDKTARAFFRPLRCVVFSLIPFAPLTHPGSYSLIWVLSHVSLLRRTGNNRFITCEQVYHHGTKALPFPCLGHAY